MGEETKKLECPFTWKIDKTLYEEFEETEELVVDAGDEPLFAFITAITTVYFEAENFKEEAVQKLKMLDDHWEKLDQKQLDSSGVSAKVLLHVKEATKYYVYDKAGDKLEAQHILANLEDAANFQNAIDSATVNGCKSVVWSRLHEKAYPQIMEWGRLATLGSPNCPLWHFILSKGLRHARHDAYGIDEPLEEERKAVLRSCQLSETPFYRMRLAQMYREMKMFDEAKAIYLDIYEADPKGHEILLRLARAFTSFRDFEKAEDCFEKAAGYPENIMYHHYKGIFFIKIKEFRSAAFHFKKATKRDNYRAHLLYAWSLAKVNKSFDFIEYLKSLLKKYTKFPKFQQQTLLHIVMHYYYTKQDLKNTLVYLLKAIQFDPKSGQLEAYTNTTLTWENLNIYEFTYERLQDFQKKAQEMNPMQDTVEKLRDYCEEYRKNKT